MSSVPDCRNALGPILQENLSFNDGFRCGSSGKSAHDPNSKFDED
jgi:hypothetical protein